MNFKLPDISDELPGWLIRGVFCALTSFGWAYAMGFTHGAEIVGMILGVAFWVIAFALLTAWRPGPVTTGWGRYGRALKVAAWIKIGLTLVGVPALLGLLDTNLGRWLSPLAVTFSLDMLLGLASLQIVCVIGGYHDIEHIARLDSVAWTALTTVIEGALMAAVIGVIAIAVLGWWRWGGLVRWKTNLSPVRRAD